MALPLKLLKKLPTIWLVLFNFDVKVFFVVVFTLDFVTFYYYHLEACSFKIRDRKGMDPDWKWVEKNQEE